MISAQNHNPKLIIRSDDMGAFHSVNEACLLTVQQGLTTSIEIMTVTPWFPEAVKMLAKESSVDVGIHLTLTSEWENMKWRPLTLATSLTDSQGYFYPMLHPHEAYPGQALIENEWTLEDIEQEFRAQIELGLQAIPRISHLSGHMGCMSFDDRVLEVATRLAQEYHLTFIDGDKMKDKYNIEYVGYSGSNKTAEDKVNSFIATLSQLEKGKNYIFVDHPALNNKEIETIGHIGYEWVPQDRQGVTDLLTNPRVKEAIDYRQIDLVSYVEVTKSLPRSMPKDEHVSISGINNFLKAVKEEGHELHSFMMLRNGKVVAEQWFGDNTPLTPHAMYSVSKTFTAMALGFAVAEERLNVTDKVVQFFPDKLPKNPSEYLQTLCVKDLLTMSVGHNVQEASDKTNNNSDWVQALLSVPIETQPGLEFDYNSMATYLVSAIIQRVTGEKLLDYLTPRLFRPLGITNATWDECPQGIAIGGYGLSVKTEDMAKLGQLILQKGKWNDKQLLPESWIDEMTTIHIASAPAGYKRKDVPINPDDSDWLQGYGYQMWRCRHNGVRADGAYGQFIIILPDKNAVVAITANISDMQNEINLVWDHILPALK
ncbi:MAG: ChbG/HpnK family deacetylase [Bacteroides sp.]|nr:ChbG/HpnK family deacetylase [Bacteroides sp.]MDD4054297.1 ChbG/HpnK family deacetylase [Bacteroides sp.]